MRSARMTRTEAGEAVMRPTVVFARTAIVVRWPGRGRLADGVAFAWERSVLLGCCLVVAARGQRAAQLDQAQLWFDERLKSGFGLRVTELID